MLERLPNAKKRTMCDKKQVHLTSRTAETHANPGYSSHIVRFLLGFVTHRDILAERLLNAGLTPEG